jgi:HK97 family phage major capsid protein
MNKKDKELEKKALSVEDEYEEDDDELETDEEVEDENKDEEKKGDEEDDDEEKSLNKQVEDLSEKIAKRIASKFFTNVEKQRSKFFGDKSKKSKGNEEDYKVKTVGFFKAVLNGETERAKTMTTSTGDTPKGGYLIPPAEFVADVLRIASEYGVARREMMYLPFSGPGNSRQVPALGTSVSVTWTNEATKKGATQPVLNLVTQTLKKLSAIVPFTEELLEDSAVDLYTLLVDLFAEAIGVEEDAQFLAGTGSPWTGVLKNGSVQVVNMGTGEGFSAITADDLLDMTSKVKPSVRRGGKFYMHTTVMDVVRKLKDTQGNYIYQQPAGDIPAKVWGYEVVETDVMPALTDSAAATAFVIFANLKKVAIMGDKQQMRVKLLDQATITDTDGQTAINLAEQDVLALRVVERVGYVLALPAGVCVLKSGASS